MDFVERGRVYEQTNISGNFLRQALEMLKEKDLNLHNQAVMKLAEFGFRSGAFPKVHQNRQEKILTGAEDHDLGKLLIFGCNYFCPDSTPEARSIFAHHQDYSRVVAAKKGKIMTPGVAVLVKNHHPNADFKNLDQQTASEVEMLVAADVIHSLVQHRPYRDKPIPKDAIHKLTIEEGRKFNPQIKFEDINLALLINYAAEHRGWWVGWAINELAQVARGRLNL